MRPRIRRQKALAEIVRIIQENAALLNEPPELIVRLLRDGRVRIYLVRDGRLVRSQFRQYSSLDTAVEASRDASARAKRAAEMIRNGTPKSIAVRSV